MNPDVRNEIYLALVLLGAEPMLLGALDSWRRGADDKDVLADLRNWNEAKRLELEEWLPSMGGAELEAAQARIRAYERVREALRPAA